MAAPRKAPAGGALPGSQPGGRARNGLPVRKPYVYRGSDRAAEAAAHAAEAAAVDAEAGAAAAGLAAVLPHASVRTVGEPAPPPRRSNRRKRGRS